MTTSKEVLEILGEPNAYAIKICDLIKNVVSNYYELPMSVFQGKSRKRPVIKAKQTSVYFIRQALPKATLQMIGKEMRYDHATILHCIKTINNLLDTDKETQIDVAEISRILQMEQDALTTDDDIELKYYYINLANCISLKLPDGKAIVLTGYTMDEAKAFALGNPSVFPLAHKDTGLFILEKKKTTDDGK